MIFDAHKPAATDPRLPHGGTEGCRGCQSPRRFDWMFAFMASSVRHLLRALKIQSRQDLQRLATGGGPSECPCRHPSHTQWTVVLYLPRRLMLSLAFCCLAGFNIIPSSRRPFASLILESRHHYLPIF
jgi:hypothetical protein